MQTYINYQYIALLLAPVTIVSPQGITYLLVLVVLSLKNSILSFVTQLLGTGIYRNENTET